MKKVLIDFLLDLNDRGLINNYDFDYEKVAQDFANKDENGNDFIADVSKRLYLDDISIELYSNDSDEDYRIDLNISNINRESILNKEQAVKLYEYLGASLNE